MKINLSILLFFTILIGCTKKEYIDEYVIEEPIIINNTNSISPFNIKTTEIADTWISIEWETAQSLINDKIKYDIAVNDSVVAYELSDTNYKIEGLLPDTEFKVSVIAIDSTRNSVSVNKDLRTMKSFIQNIISYDFDFEYFNFTNTIANKNGELIVMGRFRENPVTEYGGFILKLDSNFNKQWLNTNFPDKEVSDIIEINDGGYLIVYKDCIYKINEFGGVIWNYTPPEYSVLNSATEDPNGDFIVVGENSRNWGSDISIEYMIIELSINGEEEWIKYGGTTFLNSGQDIIIEPNGEFLILGLAEYTGSTFENLSDAKSCYWLLWTDSEGNLTEQKFFPNQYEGGDIPRTLIYTTDQNYLLLGTATGNMPPYGYSSTKPRFLNISTDGSILWDKYYDLGSGGYFPTYKDWATLENGDNLILTYDDEGIAISTINNVGVLGMHIKLSGFPGCIFIESLKNGDYYCVTGYGQIIIFNHEGYIE